MRAPALLFAALLAFTNGAFAQDFPSRPMRIVVPNPPGGTVDIVARAVAHGIEKTLGQPVIVDIKPGGNNIIGTDAVARAAPDGYTLLLAGTHLTVNPLLRKLPYDGLNAFAPVALLASTPLVIAVHPSVEASTIRELLAIAKAKPGQLNCASSNPGSAIHLAVERWRAAADVQFNYIPFQGGIQAVQAVVAGHAPVLVAPLSDAAPFIAAGKLRALAVTSLRRAELLRDVPTLDESGFGGFHAVQWFGAVASAGTPKAIIARLGAEMRRAVEMPDVRGAFSKLGIAVTTLDAEAFADFLLRETQTFAAVIREGNIKGE